MQITSSGWSGKVAAPFRQLNYSVSIAWGLATASGVNFFTIGTSTIGGPDIIKSGGGAVSFFDKYNYLDYSAYVMSVDVKKGLGQYPFGTFMAQADVELNNTSRLFLPGFDRTIGSGILPNRPISIGLGLSNEYMRQFIGFTGEPETNLKDKVTTLHAFDAFNFINGFLSQASGAYVGYTATQIMAALYTEMGFAASQYVLDQSLQSAIGYAATFNKKAGDVINDLCMAEQALSFADENGILRFWNRQHFNTTSGQIAFDINYSQAADIQYQNTPIINDVQVTAKPRAAAPYDKVWDLASPITLVPGDQLYIVSFSDDDGALPVLAIDGPVANASGTSFFTANTASDGSGSDASGNVVIRSVRVYGTEYWITFGNTAGSNIYITSMGLYGIAAKVIAQIDERYYDQLSIDTYGRNPSNNGETLEINNDFIQDRSTANSLARTLVYEYKDARKRFIVPMGAKSDPAIQIGDYGRLRIEETGEVKTVWAVGKEEQLSRSKKYTQTIQLEERNIYTFFTIGTSTIGGPDAIAP